MTLPTYPEKKIPQTSPNPQQRKKFLDKLLVKRPGAHLPGGPVGEILESWFFTKNFVVGFFATQNLGEIRAHFFESGVARKKTQPN